VDPHAVQRMLAALARIDRDRLLHRRLERSPGQVDRL